MRRSVLVRFLGLSLAVALGAVIATAVLATYSTSEQLQGELDGSANQLQVDSGIYARLTGYAADHQSWAGVDELVHSIAAETGRRIALVEPDGTVIADSARRLGVAPDLPSVPTATVDAAGGSNNVSGFVTIAGEEGLPVWKLAASAPAPNSENWGLTAEERRLRAELADQVATCLDVQGKDLPKPPDPVTGKPLVVEKNAATSGGIKYGRQAERDGDLCGTWRLQTASALAKKVNADEVRRTSACLSAAHLTFQPTEAPNGLQVLAPPLNTVPSPEFGRCVLAAHKAALTPYVAPEARLYLGARTNFDVFSGQGLLRTAATALGVLLIAALVTILAGRRLVRPILALTGAAQRMASGDHGARVPVTGRDEVSRLSQAFSAMAESVQQHDHQRKAMVSDVAHELRTPLANIKGYLVASEDGVVPLDRALVSSLLEEAELLEHLVVDLQDLALADAGMLRLHPARRDLSELAQQVVAAHRPAAETAGVTLTAEVPGPAPATVDGARIRQALGNLVANAIRFTPPSGQVTVAVRPASDGYDLQVTDTGAGIAAEHLPHVFDRFYRAEGSRSRATGGSGLGLAITKHLVDAHHGTVTVTSTLGAGSTFTIHLPRRPE